MSYANVDDVSIRLGRPISTAAEVNQVNAWLGDVEAAIAARFVRAGLVLSARVAADDPSLATVVRVECEAVIRRVNQPSPGRTSTTRSVDDVQITDRWEGDAIGMVDAWFTDTDWADLLPSVTSGAFTTRPGFAVDAATDDDAWL